MVRLIFVNTYFLNLAINFFKYMNIKLNEKNQNEKIMKIFDQKFNSTDLSPFFSFAQSLLVSIVFYIQWNFLVLLFQTVGMAPPSFEMVFFLRSKFGSKVCFSKKNRIRCLKFQTASTQHKKILQN